MQAYYICQNYCYCNEHESDYGEFCITSLKITCWGQPLCLRVTTWRRILWISSFCDWEVNCTRFRTITQAHAKCVSWCVTLLCNSLRFLLPFLIWCITSNVKTCWCHTKYLPETTFPHSYTSKQIPNQDKVFSPQGQGPDSPSCPLFSGPWMHSPDGQHMYGCPDLHPCRQCFLIHAVRSSRLFHIYLHLGQVVTDIHQKPSGLLILCWLFPPADNGG